MKITDEQLITTFLARGGSQKRTAEQLGMSKVWICKRLNRESAQELLAKERRRILDISINKIISLNGRAVEKLEEMLYSKNEFVVLQAVSKIFSITQNYIATKDIIARLEMLETEKH